MLEHSKRPLFWLGHGIRLSGAVDLIEPLLDEYKIPVITSWQGKDMLRHDHPRFFGHAGVYGHRIANTIVQSADLILAIGTRLSLMQTGFDLAKFAPNAQVVVFDIDANEASKSYRFKPVVIDAKQAIQNFLDHRLDYAPKHYQCPGSWLIECSAMQDEMPWLESPLHDDTNGFINSYRFMWELNKWLKPDQVIVTDMGTALLCSYPMLRLNARQRLITSTGLGEMGFGLPSAVGASISMGKGEVLCLNCDGGMMFNLQELATIRHHKLPIKIIVFNNGGYNMISQSQKTAGMEVFASDSKDLSFPSWSALASSFGLETTRIQTWNDMGKVRAALDGYNACVIEVMMDPNQKFGPKLYPGKNPDGSTYSPSLTELQ